MQTHLLFLLCLLPQLLPACPINPSQAPPTMECMLNAQCSYNQGVDRIFYQYCNTSWYYGTTDKTVTMLASSDGFVSNDRPANNFKMGLTSAIINYDNTELYYFQFQSEYFNLKLQNITSFIDYQFYQRSDSTFQLVLLDSSRVTTFYFNISSLQIIKQQVYNFSVKMSLIRHIEAQFYVIAAESGDILIFNTVNNQIVTTNSNTNGGVLQLQSKVIDASLNFYKIYAYFSSKILIEYVLLGSTLTLQRTSNQFNVPLFSIKNYINSSYLITSDTAGVITQIDLNSGMLVGRLNLSSHMATKDNTSLVLLLNNSISFYLFNTANKILEYSTITNSQGALILTCQQLFYYSAQMSRCIPCNSSCASCSPINGSCIQCYDNYFVSDGDCESCFYSQLSLISDFNQCFSVSDKQLMENSKIVVNLLSTSLSKLAVFLNMCGLLFVFLKLINNWSIICLYFFVNVQIPFFLQNILLVMFQQINKSVFETIGINFNPSININNQQQLNSKLSATGLTLDFVQLNFQSFVMFFYSIVMLQTLYKFMDYWLCKKGTSLFEQGTATYVLDEFVGIFSTTLLPLYSVIFNARIINTKSNLNYMLHSIFAAFILISPVLFIIFRNSPVYRYKLNKVRNQNQAQIAAAIQKGLVVKASLHRQRQSLERCLYALLTFSIALLANCPQPRIFFYLVSAVHIATLWVSFTDKSVKVNSLIQNIQFFAFHVCFSLLYYIDSQVIKFNISLALVVMIILMAVHQMIASVISKFHFAYTLIKTYLQRRQQLEKLLVDNRQFDSPFERRLHPSEVAIAKISSQTKLNFSIKSFRVIFQQKKHIKHQGLEAYPNSQREQVKHQNRSASKTRKKIYQTNKHLT